MYLAHAAEMPPCQTRGKEGRNDLGENIHGVVRPQDQNRRDLPLRGLSTKALILG